MDTTPSDAVAATGAPSDSSAGVAGAGAVVGAETARQARGASVERPEDLARAYALAAQTAFSLAYFADRLADPAPSVADAVPAPAAAPTAA